MTPHTSPWRSTVRKSLGRFEISFAESGQRKVGVITRGSSGVGLVPAPKNSAHPTERRISEPTWRTHPPRQRKRGYSRQHLHHFHHSGGGRSDSRLRRVLRPGGQFIFFEQGFRPILGFTPSVPAICMSEITIAWDSDRESTLGFFTAGSGYNIELSFQHLPIGSSPMPLVRSRTISSDSLDGSFSHHSIQEPVPGFSAMRRYLRL
jgi:hypothetical protein